MDHQETGSSRPHSPMLNTPPDTRSPTSPLNSDENLPTPMSHHILPDSSSGMDTPSSSLDSKLVAPQENYLGPRLESKASGSPLLHQTEQMGRERISPTRPIGLREQQQQPPSRSPSQPNHFTPAFYTGQEKDEGYGQGQSSTSSNVNGIGGAQPRRFYANTTPTSYTMPGAHPLTRAPTDSVKVDPPTRQGFYDSPAYWLILYFFFNLGLTLFNKIVLVSFPFPYVSSANTSIQELCSKLISRL
jgi:hypothetical protein